MYQLTLITHFTRSQPKKQPIEKNSKIQFVHLAQNSYFPPSCNIFQRNFAPIFPNSRGT